MRELAGTLRNEMVEEHTYENGEIDWHEIARDAYVIRPKGKVDAARRWVCMAPAWAAVMKQDVSMGDPVKGVEYDFYVESLLAGGFHVVGVHIGRSLGSPAGVEVFDQLYELLTSEYHLHPKARLLGASNGGLIVYAWAFRNPDCVDRIFGLYPSLDLRSWPGLDRAVGPGSAGTADPEFAYGDMRASELEARLAEFNPIDNLKPLADAGVAIYHIHGDRDAAVPFEPNSGEAIRRYRAMGGQIEVEKLVGRGHEAGGPFYDSQEAVAFLVE